jgi:PAS domain S-box-containing protein
MNNSNVHGPRARITIKLRLAIWYSVLIVAILSAVGLTTNLGLPFFSYGGRRTLERERIFNNLNLVADLKKEQMVRWLEERSNDAVVLSNSESVSRTLSAILSALANPAANETQKETLRKLSHVDPDYRSLVNQLHSMKDTYGVCDAVTVADANTGTIVASTDSTDLGVDISQSIYFGASLRSLDTYIGDLSGDQQSESQIFHISRRVEDESGEVIGVLVMTVVTDNIITQVLQTGGGLGETGEVLLVDQQVRTMAHLKYPLPTGQINTPLEYRISTKPAVLAASGEEGIIESRDYRDVPVYAAYRHIRIRPDGGWGLVVKIDKAELFAPMWDDISHQSIVGLIGILAAILLTYILAGKISTPISLLSDTARDILAGRLTSRAPVSQNDEVGLLAETFNAMLDRLQHAQEVLEERVHDRTAELSIANDNLMSEVANRQMAMEELSSSQERYQDLYDNSPDMYGSVDANTATIIRCNQTLASATGYTKDEIVGRSIFEMYDPDSLLKAKAAFQTYTRTGELTNTEMQLRHKDGSKLDVMLNVTAVRDDKGNVTESRSAWRDITERNRTLSELHASEERFRAVFQTTPASIAVTSYPDGKFLEVNHSFEKSLGYTRDEILNATGDSLHIYKNPSDRENIIDTLAGNGYAHVPDLCLVTKSGESIYVDNHLTLKRVDFVNTVVSVFTDITERKVLQEKLRGSEEKYSRTFDLSPACITLTTFPGGEIIDVNQAFEEVFGHSKEEVLGKTVIDIALYENLDHRKRNQDNFRESGFIHVPELHLVSKSGTPVIVDSRASLIEIDDEQFAISVFFDVTERIRADKELKIAKDHAVNLIETANVMVVELDTEGLITTFNHKAEEITGYTMSELNERNWFEVLVPRDRYPEVWGEFERNLSDTPRKNFENPILTKDGVERHISWQNSQLHESGDVVGTLSFGVDITERKQAEEDIRNALQDLERSNEELHRSDAMLSNTGRMAAVGGWEIDALTREKSWSDQTFHIFELPVGEVPQGPSFYHPDDQQQLVHAVDRALDHGEPYDLELRFITAKGNHRWVRTMCETEVVDGRTVMVRGAIQDITDRKQAEEVVRKALQDLELSSEELRRTYAMLHNSGRMAAVGGWEMNLETKINTFSDQTFHIYELPLGEVPPVEKGLSFYHPDDQQQLVHSMQRAIEHGEAYDLELRFITAKGNNRWVRTMCETEVVEGKTVVIRGAMQDITERKKIEEETQQGILDLERSNKELEQFAYVASHDLQEPLRMVTSYTQLLAKRYQGQLDDTADEFISFAVDGATRMQALIQDLLAFSQVGRLDKQSSSVDCHQILGNVLLDLNTAVEEAGATVTYNKLPTVTGNSGQLERLFRNLISNSLKFRGEEAPIISIEAEMKGEDWFFNLRDNGIGIDGAHLERIFVIFQRLHSRDEYPGTGIGLAICRRIVEYHNGSIWAESESGKGTDICFTLPVTS